MIKNKENSNRVVFLDYIRGIAALLVVCSHSFEAFIPSFHNIQITVFNIGMIGVVAFFMVSGFVIPFSLERYKSVKLFANSRFFRIYPLYIAVFLITLVLFRFNIMGEWGLLKGNLMKNILVHIFFLQDYLPKEKFGIQSLVGGAWTLFIEMVWYIIFSFIYIFGLNNKNKLVLTIANLVLLLLTLASFFIHIRIPPGRYILLFCCFVGLFVYRYFNGEISKKSFAIISLFSFINIYLALYVGFGIYKSESFSTACVLNSYTLAFLVCIVFYIIREKVKGALSILLSFIGKISYSLYLAHAIILISLEKFGSQPIFSIITIIASVIFACVLYKYVEKPGVALGKMIAKKIVISK